MGGDSGAAWAGGAAALTGHVAVRGPRGEVVSRCEGHVPAPSLTLRPGNTWPRTRAALSRPLCGASSPAGPPAKSLEDRPLGCQLQLVCVSSLPSGPTAHSGQVGGGSAPTGRKEDEEEGGRACGERDPGPRPGGRKRLP